MLHKMSQLTVLHMLSCSILVIAFDIIWYRNSLKYLHWVLQLNNKKNIASNSLWMSWNQAVVCYTSKELNLLSFVGRTDTLTLQSMAWNNLKVHNLCHALCARYFKVTNHIFCQLLMYWMQCLFDAWEWPFCILQTKKNHTKELESLATLKAELGIDVRAVCPGCPDLGKRHWCVEVVACKSFAVPFEKKCKHTVRNYYFI